jgi:predicted dehydrogenase/threonine dehydrogenase-like Zn-dependent dehydrogenase
VLQVARRLKDGRLELVEVPGPAPGPGMVTVAVEASIVSSGTERSTLEVARKGLLAKARARPEQARQVIERARREGVRSTAALVRERLEQLGPLGYSAAGTVMAAGPEVRRLSPGDRVAIGGAGFANHAETDVVPSLLCARVPDGVALEDAAFTTLGSIALNGFRLGGADLGSTVAVVGLGLIGQLAVRVARAAGCTVLGVDLEERLLDLARDAGADVVLRSDLDGESAWAGAADAVLVCASSEESDPVELGAELARDRAAVVVIGDVGMDVPRTPFYEKELELRVARSYGPGRYDPDYELHGIDYPIGFVRWTEQRNMEAFLALVSDGAIRPSELVTHRFPLAEAERAFEVLTSERPVAIALQVDRDRRAREIGSRDGRQDAGERTPGAARRYQRRPLSGAKPRLGLVGAGAFATATLIPGLVREGFEPVVITSAAGLSAASAGRRFGFSTVASDAEDVFTRGDVDLVAIATQHDTHADLAAAALAQGKAVYLEKPLTLDWAGLARVRDAQEDSGAPLIVGFNRRHAPLAEELRGLPGPKLMAFRVNAGPLPRTHWANDLARGGGRLKGEGCHFIDFLCNHAGSDPIAVNARGFPSSPDLPLEATDNFSIQVWFRDGSVGSLNYAADAPSGPGKERFEVSSPGTYAVLDDFKSATVWRSGKRRRLGGRTQDKGFRSEFAHVAKVVRGEDTAPQPDAYYVSTLATLAAAQSLGSGRPEPVVSAQLPLA